MNFNAVDRFGDYVVTTYDCGPHSILTSLMLVEGFDDDLLDISCGNARNRSDLCRLRLSMQTWSRHVIAIADAGLGRVRRRHGVTRIIEQQSRQQVVTCLPDACF